MKKNKLVIAMLLFTIFGLSSMLSQTINGVPLEDIDAEYIQIVGTSKMMSKKVTINIDFGQFDNIWKVKDTQIIDKDGKPLDFNSMIDALNFMSKNGYDFVDANAMAINNVNVYHFLLKKVKE